MHFGGARCKRRSRVTERFAALAMSGWVRFQIVMDQVARWSAVALLFAAPTSRALFNLSALLLIVGWCLAGRYASRIQTIRSNPTTLPTLLMALVIVAGASYTPASWDVVFDHWERYSKFLLLLLMISLFDHERWRQRAWVAFMTAMFFVLASTYANIWLDLPWSKSQNQGWGQNHSVLENYIAQGLAMAFFVAFAVLRGLRHQALRWKLAWLITAALGVLSITHLSMGRTGQIAILVVLALLAFVEAPARWRWRALLVFSLLAAMVVWSSPILRDRFSVAISEVMAFEVGSDYTSVGARLYMWHTAISLWLQSVWIGHGTGAYHGLAQQAFADPVMCAIGCFHPHNQLLFFAVDYGLIGAGLFLFWLWRPIRFAYISGHPEGRLLMCFMGVLLVDILFHGALWIHMEAYFFFTMLALLMSKATVRSEMKTPDS
jgi:O-antigen ligase